MQQAVEEMKADVEADMNNVTIKSKRGIIQPVGSHLLKQQSPKVMKGENNSPKAVKACGKEN